MNVDKYVKSVTSAGKNIARKASSLALPMLEDPVSFFEELGIATIDEPLAEALNALADVIVEVEALGRDPDLTYENAQQIYTLVRTIITQVRAIGNVGDVADLRPGLGSDAVELLTTLLLANARPVLRHSLIFLTIMEAAFDQEMPEPLMRAVPGQTFGATAAATPGSTSDVETPEVLRGPFRIDRFHPSRIVDLLQDPVGVLKAAYGNDLLTDEDAAKIAKKLFPALHRLLGHMGVSGSFGVNAADRPLLGEWATPLSHAMTLRIDDPLRSTGSVGAVVSLSPASRGDLGVVIAPFGTLDVSKAVRGWNITVKATPGVDLIAWGRHGPTIITGSGVQDFVASAEAVLPTPEEGPAFVFGSASGTRLELGGARLAADVSIGAKGLAMGLSAGVSKSALVISADGDGFLSEILPPEGIRAPFDLGIAWSRAKGFSLSGSASLETDLPVGLSLAGVTLTTVHLGLRANDDAVSAEVSATLKAKIGPIQAAVDRIGIATDLSFPEDGGNFGIADLRLDFKGPTGVGIAIDAHGVLTGGGFLKRDLATGEYGGVLQVSLKESLTLSAYGLLSTRMPDGSRGYSLLIFITAENFKPIPLGFGFTLQSIGGMLGIHRTFDVEALRRGLRSDTLSKILFPRDPVANAPAILQALGAVFPARRGSYLLGLLARICWFTPTLVQMDLALILELGARTRLIALGRVSALLPTRENDLIRLNLDAIGVLDFDAGSFEADAVLVDSRLAKRFPVTGAAAVRARWSGDPNFLLAVGGFNPRFAPPAGFPQLERVAIALSTGSNPRLICESYLAVTSNTVQFGAHVSLYAEAAGFSISGDLGFDTLVTLTPPRFAIDFRASVQLKRGGTNLFKVTLDGALEGPLPLKLRARAKFEILWFDFSVSFDYTLAEGSPNQARPPAIDLHAEVRNALVAPANWSTRRGGADTHGVVLAPAAAAAGPVLDPLGQLVVVQQVAPLNLEREIDTYGGARVANGRKLKLTAVFANSAGVAVTAEFAPGQYFAMNDDDRLVAPSFETMDAGVVLGADNTTFSQTRVHGGALIYDKTVLGPLNAGSSLVASQADSTGSYALPPEAFRVQIPTGAAARAPTRRTGQARFHNPTTVTRTGINPISWDVVPRDGVTPPPAAPAARGLTSASASSPPAASEPLAIWAEGQARTKRSPRLILVPSYERTHA